MIHALNEVYSPPKYDRKERGILVVMRNVSVILHSVNALALYVKKFTCYKCKNYNAMT